MVDEVNGMSDTVCDYLVQVEFPGTEYPALLHWVNNAANRDEAIEAAYWFALDSVNEMPEFEYGMFIGGLSDMEAFIIDFRMVE
jgi:hypothetical protein